MFFDTIISKSRSPEVQKLMTMGLGLQDAEDVFQDASVALYDVMSSQRLAVKGTWEAYLHGICQNMGYKKLEEIKRRAAMVDDDKLDRLLALTEDAEEPAVMATERDEEALDYGTILQQLLERLSPRDHALIYGFYIEGKSLNQIATEQAMANAEVARTTKCRIMSRLREQAHLNFYN